MEYWTKGICTGNSWILTFITSWGVLYNLLAWQTLSTSRLACKILWEFFYKYQLSSTRISLCNMSLPCVKDHEVQLQFDAEFSFLTVKPCLPQKTKKKPLANPIDPTLAHIGTRAQSCRTRQLRPLLKACDLVPKPLASNAINDVASGSSTLANQTSQSSQTDLDEMTTLTNFVYFGELIKRF